MSSLHILRTFFPTGTAEAERAFLREAFVVPEEYYEIIQPPERTPKLLIGRKGSGKSAILETLEMRCAEAEVPALLLTPDEIKFEVDAAVRDVSSIKRVAYEQLLAAVAAKVGSKLSGFLSNDEAVLLRAAVKDGSRGEETLGKLLGLLTNVGKAATTIDFNAFLPVAEGVRSKTVRNSVAAVLQKWGKVFYLLLDDTDQVATPDQADQLNRIWGFILGARRLTQELPSIRCLITLRTEVWTRLQNDGAGQRDQVDHFRLSKALLSPDEESIEAILRTRLNLARSHAIEAGGNPDIDLFFTGTSVTLPGSTEQRSWVDYIVKTSRDRPRDAIQLVGLLAEKALASRQPIIDSAVAAQVAPEFSEACVRDLKIEFGAELPTIEEIVRTFSGLPFIMKADELKSHLDTVPTRFSVTLRGKTIRPDDREAILRLWSMLHEVGFINPKIPDAREPRKFRHGSHHRDPGLVTVARWNDISKYEWEIHPAFRSFLLKNQAEEAARLIVPRSPARKT